jgi:hypothetical protein
MRCSFVLVVAGALAASVHGQCSTPMKIIGSDASFMDYFGSSVAVDTAAGSPMLISGSTWRTTPSVGRTGLVSSYLKSGNTWTETATISSADLLPLDEFGASVAYDDPYLVVGASGVDGPQGSNTGSVYFFERSGSGWINRGRHIPLNAMPGGAMGRATAVTASNGGWAVIGAPETPNGSTVQAGAAFVYRRQAAGNWVYVQTITDNASSDGGHWQRLGAGVAVAGNVMVVSAYEGDPDYVQASLEGYLKVYRYDGTSWVQSGPARWAPPSSYGHFGYSVDTDGTYIVASMPWYDTSAAESPMAGAGENAGCVWVYKWNSTTNAWDVDGKLIARTKGTTYLLGETVKISGGKVFAASQSDGRVYQFRRLGANNWVQEAVYGNPESGARFADSMAVSGTTVAVGAPYYSSPAELCGAVWAFNVPAGQAGDACSAATPVPAGSYTGCTTLATADGDSTCGQGGNGPGPDVWYAYTPSCTQNVIIDTIGSSYDTVLSVHSGCPTAADSATLVCNDDAGSSFGVVSMVSLNVNAGTTYFIRVAGYSGGSGDYTLRIAEYLSAPTNDSCASPVTVSSGNTYTAASCKATTDGPGTGACGANLAKDLWYRFTAPANGTLAINTCGSGFDTMLAVYPGAVCPGGALGEIACNDDAQAGTPCPATLRSSLTVGLTAGLPYMIRLGGYNGASGDAVLHVDFTQTPPACPCDWNHSGALSVQDIFDFLASYFGPTGADMNNSGATSVQDIFDFLACYFAGCN